MVKKYKTQVLKKHYFNLKYDTKQRWISYWYQINEVVSLNPKSILEIGIGNKLVSSYLKSIGFKVTTCDFDKRLNPDIIASVNDLPLKDKSFECILCAQVLEHSPFSKFKTTLNEIYRVTDRYALITLPHFSLTNLYFGVKLIPFIPKNEIALKIDFPIEHKFKGEHYWEIGKKGFSLSKIEERIRKSGFKIKKSFYPKDNPYHHFFVLEK